MTLSLPQTYKQRPITPMENLLSEQEKAIISISSRIAKNDFVKLRQELIAGLEAGLTITQLNEVLVHVYAYCGFPRSIRALETFSEVLRERRQQRIHDTVGKEATPLADPRSKYNRGKDVVQKLTGVSGSLQNIYGELPVVLDVFLNEHLFADIFGRDVLTYQQRELATIAILSSMGDSDNMLRTHLNICLHIGITPGQLQEFIVVVRRKAGPRKSGDAELIVKSLLQAYQPKL